MPLPMIFQSGYLTVKAWNRDMNTYLIDFPNNEVKKGFVTLIANDYLKIRTDAGSWARDMVSALNMGDTELFQKLLTSFLADIPYSAPQGKRTRA